MTKEGYLKTNTYGLNPSYSETITNQIIGNELDRLGIRLEVQTGHINGRVDEYDNQSTVRDTIKVYHKGEFLCDIRINSDELNIPLNFGYEPKDFIGVTVAVPKAETKDKDILKYFRNELSSYYGTTGIGLCVHNFMVISADDLDFAKDIILKKLEVVLQHALCKLKNDKEQFLIQIKSKYDLYLAQVR